MTDYDNEFSGAIPGVEGDVTKVENQYKSWEDGEYAMLGIHSYTSKDKDRDLPIFVIQGDKTVCRFKTLIRGKDEKTGQDIEVDGPPMSATYSEMCMLVRTYGGDPSKLPSEPTTKFLQDAMDLINSAKKTKRAGVNKGRGWISWVEGMNPPTGKEVYLWEFTGFWNESSTDPVCFESRTRTGRNGSYEENVAWAKYRLIADAWGNPSPYAGYEISVKVYNPYSGGTKLESGKLFPATTVGEKGGVPISVARWNKFVTLYCMPDYAQHYWESDPEKSEYGINEFDNPLAVVNAMAKKSKRMVVAVLGQKKSGAPQLDLNDLAVYKGQPIDLDKRAEEESKQPRELITLVDYLEKKAGFHVFEQTAKDASEINLTPTTEGANWLRENIVAAWDALHFPVDGRGRRNIGKLDGSQLTELTDYLKNLNGDGFENVDAALAEEDDDIAF